MNRGHRLGLLLALAGTLVMDPALANGQVAPPDEASMQEEIIARYRAFEGGPEEQTWERSGN